MRRAVAVNTITETARSHSRRTMRAWFADECGSTVCNDDDERDVERFDQIEDQLSVGSPEDAELVLEQDRVEAIRDDGRFLCTKHVVMPE